MMPPTAATQTAMAHRNRRTSPPPSLNSPERVAPMPRSAPPAPNAAVIARDSEPLTKAIGREKLPISSRTPEKSPKSCTGVPTFHRVVFGLRHSFGNRAAPNILCSFWPTAGRSSPAPSCLGQTAVIRNQICGRWSGLRILLMAKVSNAYSAYIRGQIDLHAYGAGFTKMIRRLSEAKSGAGEDNRNSGN